MVSQGHTDQYKNVLVYNTTTLRQNYVRTTVTMNAILVYDLWSQDVSQANFQSEEELRRKIFMRPPKKFWIDPKNIFRLLKSLYGLAD